MIESQMDFGWGKLGGTSGARCGARVGYRYPVGVWQCWKGGGMASLDCPDWWGR